MVISFSNDKARAQLLEQGVVHTFRLTRRKRKNGKNWVNAGRTKTKIADVYIKEEGLRMIANIHPYVATSGFSSMGEWWSAIQKENRKQITQATHGWLYKVTRAPEDPSRVMHSYKVSDPSKRGYVPVLTVTKQDLLDYFSEIDVRPTTMTVKDMACSKGLHGWEAYTRLRVQRIK